MPIAKRKDARETRTERMELRVQPSAKAAIKRAMALSGLSAADLAFEAANRVIDAHERILLAGADRQAFLALIANPPAANARLKRAFRRHRQATSG
jgi:uncharacterized protein (DUF1778 family)